MSLWPRLRRTAWLTAIVLLTIPPIVYGHPDQTSKLSAYPPADFVGKMTVSPNRGPAGTLVSVKGSGLHPNTTMDLIWHTVKGSWVVNGPSREEFHGRTFDLFAVGLGHVTTDSDGQVQSQFRVPAGYGFTHDVLLMQDGVIRNKAGFDVDLQVKISPTSGPVGTPITIEATGIGWQPMENSWMVMYDNKFTGVLTAVTTDGIARAVIPAAGRPGKHVIRILHGSFTFAYLNMQQSPHPDRPMFTLPFTITDGPPVLPPPAKTQALPIEAASAPPGNDSTAWVTPAAGPINTHLQITARGLPPKQSVKFLWFRVKGNTEGGLLPEEGGWRKTALELGQGVVGADGTARLAAAAPDDLGGPHGIAVVAGERVLVETSYAVTPSALALTPASGPGGTEITVHLKGVGWTQTNNIYHIVYDNAYVGYACGFNSQGDVTVFLPATGEPGWHFIDLYPGIYKGKDMPGVDNFRIPQLTYADDHPGERLPGFRFAFFVTE